METIKHMDMEEKIVSVTALRKINTLNKELNFPFAIEDWDAFETLLKMQSINHVILQRTYSDRWRSVMCHIMINDICIVCRFVLGKKVYDYLPLKDEVECTDKLINELPFHDFYFNYPDINWNNVEI